MENRQQRMRKTIAYKSMESMLALGIFTTTAICLVVTVGLTHRSRQEYVQAMFACANSIASFVDGDQVVNYAFTKKKDEEYDRVAQYMYSVFENTDLIFNLYVYVPDEAGMTYVWDMDVTNPSDTHLGERDTFIQGEKQAIKKIFSSGEKYVFYSRDRTHGFLAPCMAPIYNKKGQPVAIVGADFDVRDVSRNVASFLRVISAVSLLVMFLCMFLYYRYYLETLVRPLEELYRGVEGMVSGLESGKALEFHIDTGDEIEDLAKRFEEIYRETRGYMSRLTQMTAERERVGTELALASKIQADMLPTVFPEREDLDIFALMDPAKEVGGDFYDFFYVDRDHLAIVIADVSGKGVPASLFMMMTKILIKNSAELGFSPRQIMTKANETICSNNDEGMFVTVWLGILDLVSGHLVAVNAGHEMPALRRPGGEFELYEDPHDFVVGGLEGEDYEGYEIDLERGSTLFMYTDGVVETQNVGEELFGEERMLAALNVEPEASAEDQIRRVRAAADAFAGDAAQSDDMTMLALRYL